MTVALRSEDATSATSRRRLISASVRDVAAFLGNTPAVARASYIDPRVFDRLEQGATIAGTLERLRIDEPTDLTFRVRVEAAVLELLDEDPGAARAA